MGADGLKQLLRPTRSPQSSVFPGWSTRPKKSCRFHAVRFSAGTTTPASIAEKPVPSSPLIMSNPSTWVEPTTGTTWSRLVQAVTTTRADEPFLKLACPSSITRRNLPVLPCIHSRITCRTIRSGVTTLRVGKAFIPP